LKLRDYLSENEINSLELEKEKGAVEGEKNNNSANRSLYLI
jgi:hypothetical protein